MPETAVWEQVNQQNRQRKPGRGREKGQLPVGRDRGFARWVELHGENAFFRFVIDDLTVC